jgi:ferric-dicitrate binding protein FerR (iron transport regulator)
MSTPVGRQYELMLADGSRVWLNAASSITFPTSFSTSERRVQITGEAYFEVAHDKSRPFHVSVNGLDVQVLGTHFNINSYDNEPAIKTTLLEGEVKVTKGNSSILIAPGEQAVAMNTSNSLSIKNGVDLDKVMAWKNGKFVFQDANIKEIMRQLERWYGITVSYSENATDEEFVGVISRNVNLSQILEMLKKTGRVSFDIQDKNVIVK